MTFAQIVTSIVNIVNTSVIPLLFALAFIFFLINIVRFFFIESNDEGREKGKKALLWGFIGLLVLFCIWGIINFFVNEVNTLVTGNSGIPSTTTTAPGSTGGPINSGAVTGGPINSGATTGGPVNSGVTTGPTPGQTPQ